MEEARGRGLAEGLPAGGSVRGRGSRRRLEHPRDGPNVACGLLRGEPVHHRRARGGGRLVGRHGADLPRARGAPRALRSLPRPAPAAFGNRTRGHRRVRPYRRGLRCGLHAVGETTGVGELRLAAGARDGRLYLVGSGDLDRGSSRYDRSGRAALPGASALLRPARPLRGPARLPREIHRWPSSRESTESGHGCDPRGRGDGRNPLSDGFGELERASRRRGRVS